MHPQYPLINGRTGRGEYPPDINYFVCTLGQAAEQKPNHLSWRTVNDFIDHQARESPKRPAAGFPVPSNGRDHGLGWGFVTHTFEDLRQKSLLYSSAFQHVFSGKRTSKSIGFLCSSSEEFLLGWLGLMRCGLSVLLIAPQCQPSAVAHICKECQVSILVHDSDHLDLAQRTRGSYGEDAPVTLIRLPEIKDTSSLDGLDGELCPVSDTDVAYLHHTSGTSTGLPKPIPQTHRAAVGVLPRLDNGQETAAFTTTPLYHGGVADCFRSWTSGAMIWLFPGRDVPITSSNIIKSMECTRKATYSNGQDLPTVRYFSSVPYVLQMLAAEPDGLQLLNEMALVGVGGAALPPSVGDELVQQGVRLVSRFGSAECGFLMSSHRDYTIDKEWQYLRSNKSSHLRFELHEDGLAELIIASTWPHMAKRNRDDGSYATADLFEPHPSIPDAWKYHSRADSQLTLITGKKFDPAPLEAAIATSPHLSDCIIFGSGQQYPGALLFRSAHSEDMASEEVVDAVWQMVRQLNSESQGHTRLSRSMLVVMPKNAPAVEKSSKGTIMRAAAEKRYAADISRAYENDANDATNGHTDGNSTAFIPDHNVPSTVLDIIKGVIGTEDTIPEDEDLFSFGVDSVACIQIRAALQRQLLAADACKLPLNIVYDCGTIKNLAKHLIAMRKGGTLEMVDEIDLMKTLVSKYSDFNTTPTFPSVNTNYTLRTFPTSMATGEVVVLAGATGALGAHILDQLRSSQYVSEIYCLVRGATDIAAHERVSKSLLARHKAPLPDISSPYSKILCVPCQLSEPCLGLPPQIIEDNSDLLTYHSLAARTTIIIHAAWAVNFSTRLSSFEKDHVAGLRNLINFAQASQPTHSYPVPVSIYGATEAFNPLKGNDRPARFIFCSSTASVLGPSTTYPIPEIISHDPSTASPLGYSRSKWVGEFICDMAHQLTRLRGQISVVRIGQLCGDTKNGAWNATEAWPLMLSSVSVTGCLPSLKDPLDWLPVDIAAEAVIEIAMLTPKSLPNEEISVYHVLNPATYPTFSTLLSWLHRIYPNFRTVTPAEWVAHLENLSGKDADHPARKLLGLWKEAYGSAERGEKGAGRVEKGVNEGEVAFEMHRTKQAVSVMRDVRAIDEAQFGKIWGWIRREMMDRGSSSLL